MFTNKELEANRDYANKKIKDLLNSKKETDFDYIKDLQTLIKLKAATDEQLKEDEWRRNNEAY